MSQKYSFKVFEYSFKILIIVINTIKIFLPFSFRLLLMKIRLPWTNLINIKYLGPDKFLSLKALQYLQSSG